MKQVTALKWGATALPAIFASASAASAPATHALGMYCAAAVVAALLATSWLVRSDGVYLASFGSGGALLAFALSPAGSIVAAGTVVVILLLFDLVWLGKSLFGIVESRFDPEDRSTVSRYLGLMGVQAWRSAVVGSLAFTASVAALTTPLPVVAFSNPVSGSGILALGALLLALLAVSERGAIQDLISPRRKRGA